MRKYVDFLEGTDGKALKGASVLVLNYGTTNAATLYENDAGTVRPNPVTTDATGQFWFYAADGRYTLRITGAGLSSQTITDIAVVDPFFNQSGAGAVSMSAQENARAVLHWKQFGAIGDGASHPLSGRYATLAAAQAVYPFATALTQEIDFCAIQACINRANALGGGVVEGPPGTYKTGTDTLAMAKWVTLRGQGKHATVISYSGTGDAIKMTSAINTSTAVHTALRDLGVTMTNAAATGGCYVDVGGTFVVVEDCALTGGKFGVIFDQTELATIRRNDIEAQVAGGAGVWLVNGPDHTIGASSQFTNRILITENQFNNGGTAASHIIDDGGVSHVITCNNFNSGIITASPPVARFAGILKLLIQGNYFEGGQTMLSFASTTFYGAVGAGSSSAVSIRNNVISMSQPNTPIAITAAANPLELCSNWIGNSAASVVSGASFCASITAIGNIWTSGTLLDSDPTYLLEMDNNGLSFRGMNGLLSTSGGIGYTTGAGGSVTQATSKATQVTLNKMSGFIQTTADALAANTTVSFQLNNTNIASADAIIVHRNFGGTASAYQVWVDSVGPGLCVICIRNITGGSLSESIFLTFSIIKGSST